MDKKSSIYVIGIIIILLAILAYYVSQNSNELLNTNISLNTTLQNVTSPQTITNSEKGEEGYLRIINNNISKIYLINSNISYMISNEDYKNAAGETIVKKGDPYVTIKGTVRNDYDKDIYFWLAGNIYDSNGIKVGNVLPGHFEPGFNFPYLNVKNSSTESFEMRVIYQNKDIEYYSIYLPMAPTDRFLP